MAKKNKQSEKVYSQSTVIVVATVCILTGFIGGVVVSAIKSTSQMPQQVRAPQGMPQQAPSPERAVELDALIKETAQNPQNARAWTDLGNLYFDSGQHEKAVWAYQKSLEIQPDNANVMTDMGVMYRRLGKPKEAIKAFEDAMRVDPRHEPSRFNKGIVLLHDLNDADGAIKAWEDLLKVNPFAVAPNGQTVDELVTQFKKNLNKQ